MINILILDDEKQERELVKFLIRKKENVRIHEGKNGKEGLVILDNHVIDILITDVRMPFMNGTEVAEYARVKYPEIKILFFSGHDDFKHLRTAILVNATTYLLKPIQPEEFNTTLNQIFAEIEEMNSSAASEKKREGILETHILSELINDVPLHNLQKRFPFFDFSCLRKINYLFLIQVSQGNRKSLSAKLEDYREQHPSFYYFNHSPHQLVGYFERLRSQKEINAHIETLDKFTEEAFTYQLTEEINSLNRLNSLVYQAEKKLEERIFYQRSYPVEQTSPESLEGDMESELFEKLIHAINEGDKDTFSQSLEELIAFHQNPAQTPITLVRFSYARFIEDLVDKLNISLPETKEVIINRIIVANQYSDIVNVMGMVKEAVDYYFKGLSSTTNIAIINIKKYIFNHFDQDLYLELLAEVVSLSPRYLSDLFKKEEGIGINKYITRVRINEAKRLLETQQFKVVDIAERVGYTNYPYFVKIFREMEGLPPKKYRQTFIK